MTVLRKYVLKSRNFKQNHTQFVELRERDRGHRERAGERMRAEEKSTQQNAHKTYRC